MKNIKFLIVLYLFIISLFLLSCSNKVNYITDINEYKNLTIDVYKIDVSYDIGENEPIKFIIENEEEIYDVMNTILQTKIVKKASSDSSHTSLKIYTIDKEYDILLSYIKDGNKYYYFENDSLYNKITLLKDLYS